MRTVEASITLDQSPQEILNVFIRPECLKKWWGVKRALVEPCRGGLYSLVWQASDQCIDYVTSGIITEYLPGCQLKIGNLVYINPARPVLGPMELLILTTPEDGNTQLTVIQSGYQTGPDWEWFYQAVKEAWPKALTQIKDYLESIEVRS